MFASLLSRLMLLALMATAAATLANWYTDQVQDYAHHITSVLEVLR